MNLSTLYMRLPDKVRSQLRKYLKRAPMYHDLPSGIRIEVADRSDFGIYSEVFVCAEYDEPITAAIADLKPGMPLCILDLGANVGFFLLRIVDILRKSGSDRKVEGIAVEGAPDTFERLNQRVSPYPELENIKLVCGLVGKKNGTGFIVGGESSANAAVGGNETGGFEVGYFDLTPMAEGLPVIDLLKCDIEGSEVAFTENYGDLIAKARRIVIELHSTLCDSDQAKSCILAAGFTLISTKEGNGGAQTCHFVRT